MMVLGVYVLILAFSGITISDSEALEQPALFRLIRTVRFFEAVKLPFLPFLSRPAPPQLTAGDMEVKPGFILFSSSGEGSLLAAADKWAPLDDVVMGGVSATNLEPGSFKGRFEGVVPTERNGGFAGIRTKLFSTPLDARGSTGFRLTVRGDGQRYKFIARDSNEWNGIAWSKSFDTIKGQETTHMVKFSDLVPTKFARVVTDAGKFRQDRLSGLQVTLSKFEYDSGLNPKFTPGPFYLDIDKIEMA